MLSDAGGYAFFMESTSIEYQVERECRLQKVGGNLDSKSYGIALPQGNNSLSFFGRIVGPLENFPGSPLRSAISSAIIKLNEERKISQLKEKWWKKERGGGACQVCDHSFMPFFPSHPSSSKL